MTSKLVVNTIEADTGISSVSFASSISLSSTSVFHLGDAGFNIGADTNINRAGNGILAFNINGSEKVRITSNGGILVGKTGDSGKGLEVYASNNAAIRIQNSHTGTGVADGLLIETAFSDTLIWNYESSNIRVGTNNVERLRIDSSGRLLLGTTIEGHADADDFTIGTSTNSAGITIRTNTSGTGRLWFSDGTSGDAEYQGYIQYDHNNQNLSLGSGGSTRLRITSDGSVNKPNNPAFYAWISTNNVVYTAGTIIPWDNTDIDTRSAFETSGSDQGRFIVPTTGIYYFGWRLNRRDDSRFDIAIYKNGSIEYIDELRWEGTSGMWMAESGHYLMSCTEGQKIDMRIYSVTNAGSGQFDGGGNGYYDAFFGWMVG